MAKLVNLSKYIAYTAKICDFLCLYLRKVVKIAFTSQFNKV